MQRIDTLNKHHITHTRDTASIHRPHVTTQLLLDESINAYLGGVCKINRLRTDPCICV